MNVNLVKTIRTFRIVKTLLSFETFQGNHHTVCYSHLYFTTLSITAIPSVLYKLRSKNILIRMKSSFIVFVSKLSEWYHMCEPVSLIRTRKETLYSLSHGLREKWQPQYILNIYCQTSSNNWKKEKKMCSSSCGV